ncbi:MAG: Imm26 family immunity protein [Phycisphaerales bacterium]
MRTSRHKKATHREGDVFSLALHSGGFVPGVVARCSHENYGVLCYFFAPRLQCAPQFGDVQRLRAKDYFWIVRSSDLALRDGHWPIIGRIEDWDTTAWPVPKFQSEPAWQRGKWWVVEYSQEDHTEFVSKTYYGDSEPGFPEDGLAGCLYVEEKLTMLVDEAEQPDRVDRVRRSPF